MAADIRRLDVSRIGSLVLAALVVVAFAGTGLADDKKHGVKEGPLPADQVVRGADGLYGQRISVKGHVDDILASGVFTIEKDSKTPDYRVRFPVADLSVVVPMALRSSVPLDGLSKGRSVVIVGTLQRGMPAGSAELAGVSDTTWKVKEVGVENKGLAACGPFS